MQNDLVWIQSFGQVVDMVNPRVAEVNFRHLAEGMAVLNRYGGVSEMAVSVALHTIIAYDAAKPAARPYVLLHDCHETRIGEIPTPAALALGAVAEEMQPRFGRALIAAALASLKRRHDEVIWAAAGLPAPDAAMMTEIHRADLVALQTERRDFLSPPPRPWKVDSMGIEPAPKAYRWRPAPVVADALYALFQKHLPALATTRGEQRKHVCA